eukprot:4963456-Pyramimonas_sp.AAC.1
MRWIIIPGPCSAMAWSIWPHRLVDGSVQPGRSTAPACTSADVTFSMAWLRLRHFPQLLS